MTHLWAAGDSVRIVADSSGSPSRITWRGRAHPVRCIYTHWREDSEWWRARVWRDCFDLATTTGLEVVVYHDLLADQWYLQRLYD